MLIEQSLSEIAQHLGRIATAIEVSSAASVTQPSSEAAVAQPAAEARKPTPLQMPSETPDEGRQSSTPPAIPVTDQEIAEANAKLAEVAQTLGSPEPVVAVIKAHGIERLAEVGDDRAMLESIVARAQALAQAAA